MNRTQVKSRTTSHRAPVDDASYNRHAFDMNWARAIRFTAPTLGLALVFGGLIAMTLGGGCASKNPDVTASASHQLASADTPRPSALDVQPARPAAQAYMPPESPVAPAAPAPSSASLTGSGQALLPDSASTPTLIASTEAAGGGISTDPSSYTVQRGDTLFRIAKHHYGDGKQWKRIVSANPGLTPSSLKAGQKIVLP
jgi:nucleoid-associated protein YgaU